MVATSKGPPILLHLAAVLALACPSVFAASPATAQMVEGRLRDGESGQPVMLGRVALLDTALAVVDLTVTDHDGRFALSAPEPGGYLLVGGGFGYRTGLDGIFEMGADGYLPVDFFLAPEPLEIEGLTVTARRRRIDRKLTGAAFYQRLSEGFGQFVTPEDILARPPADGPDLLREVRGVRFASLGVNGDVLYLRERGFRTGGAGSAPDGHCLPRVFVDGIRMSNEPRGGGRRADGTSESIPVALSEFLDVEDVIAAEVYRGGAETPLQWGGSEGVCGVVLFWTEGG